MTNHVVHFEFAGPDDSLLQGFYRDVLGWSVSSMGPGYALIETPDGSPNGAIRQAPTAELTIGIGVSDLEAAVAKAVAGGGRVVMPPTDNGYVNKAQISDPAGNVVSLIEDDKPEV